MRDRGLGDGKLVPQLGAGTLPLTRDHLEHLHPPRIGQGFGDQLELLVGQGRPSRAAGFHGSMVIELSSSCQEQYLTTETRRPHGSARKDQSFTLTEAGAYFVMEWFGTIRFLRASSMSSVFPWGTCSPSWIDY